MIAARRCTLALATALLTLAAAPQVAAAAPYVIGEAAGVLEATATAGTTLAVTVDEVGDKVEFSPGAATFPSGCSGTPAKTSCEDTLMSAELSLGGDVVDVAVDVEDTARVTVVGGAESDSMSVAAPGAFELGNQAIELGPGAGNDSVTVTGLRFFTLALTGSGDGDDRYRIDASPFFAAPTLDLGAGNDVASTTSAAVTFDGGAGADTLSGAGTLNGDAGRDLLQPTALGTSIAGGADGDRLSYALLPGPATVTVTKPSATDVKVAGDAQVKTGIDEVEGTPRNDSLTGLGGPDVMLGGAGDDLLDGRGGGDILDGGPGFNTVTYASGPTPVDVNLAAGTGTAAGVVDALTAIRGLVTGPGNDVVTGASADETVVLGAGDDRVDLGDGNDSAGGGPGNDLLRGGDGNDTLDGGDGGDTATYDERTASEPVTVTLATPGGDGAAGESDSLLGIENVTGGASNDAITGDDGPNSLLGGPGVNTLDGLGGDDIVRGGPARDLITGGTGRDELHGEDDDDSINAFDGGPDVVSCGASLDDDAQVDAVDQVEGCEFASRGDVPVPVDGDGDGFVAGFDCNDANRAISPSAVDVPGDGVDQNCDGFDEAVPFVDYGLNLTISKENPRGRIVTKFIVTKLPADHRVLVTCKGTTRSVTRRCPFRRATRKPAAGRRVSLTSLFKRRRLPPGTTIEMQVTAPAFNGRVLRIPIRKAGPIRTQRLCLIAPRKAPRRCPDGDE